MGSPLGGAVAPGGGGGGVTESQLRTAAAALTASLDVNGQKIVDLGTPTAATDAATKGYVDGQITDLIYDHGGTAGARVYTSLASAVTAAGSIPGRVRIWVKATSGTPTMTGVTYALANRIELCGLPNLRTTLTPVTGAVLQDACALRNLEIENDLAAALFTSSSGGLNVVFDNTAIIDVGGTADVATLPSSSTSYFTFDNGASFGNASTMPLCTLSSGKEVYLTIRDGSVSDNAVLGSAGTLRIYQGGSGSIPTQSGFSGTLSVDTQDVVRQLGEARGNVGVNYQRIINLARPTDARDAATREHVDGSASVSLGSTSVALTAANVATGHVTLTGALSGATTATLPTGARAVWLTNGTTGTYTLRIAGFSGGFCYLLPGQTKRVVQDASGILRGEGLKVLAYDEIIDLDGDTVGTNDHTLFEIPPGATFTACEVITEEAAASGSAACSLGTDATYSDLLVSTAIGTVGTVLGAATADAGSAWTSKISAYFRTGGTMKIRNTVTTATLTAGRVRVQVIGRYLGE